MPRLFVFLMVFAAFAIPALGQPPECDLRSVWRGKEVAHYVPRAQACLAEPTAGFWYDEAVEAEIFQLVNEARLNAGLSPLAQRDELLAPARLHSLDMAKEEFIDHVGPDGRSVLERVGALDRTLIQSEMRENLAYIGGDLNYEDTGHLLHTNLFNSPAHKDNLLAPRTTHFAVGVVRAEKGAWVTQVFVRQAGELSAPLPLVLGSEACLGLEAGLIDWTAADFELRDEAGTDHAPECADEGRRENRELIVTGERTVETETKIFLQLIKLRGPSASVFYSPSSELLEQER